MIKFGQICSICRNINFACKSCYVDKEKRMPAHFVLRDLTAEEEEYYQTKGNLIDRYKIDFPEPEPVEENTDDSE